MDRSAQQLLDVNELSVDYEIGRGRYFGLGSKPTLSAVAGVSMSIRAGETFGLVGESGSGKTTTGRAIAGLVPVSAGSVRFDGEELTTVTPKRFKHLRSEIQMVFQDPISSLDPSWVVQDIVAEPLVAQRVKLTRTGVRDRVLEVLESVGLGRDHLRRYPHEFSGGQRQRIAIARALVTNPRFVIFDESVSALDVSTQSQIINLIQSIQRETHATFLFIAHDLALVRHVSNSLAVMQLGKIVEEGPSARVFDQPAHPYTEALLSAISNPHMPRLRERIVLCGELPSAAHPPSGCRFRTRCPYVMNICAEVEPKPIEVDGGGTASCHLHTSGPELAGGSILQISPKVVQDRWSHV